MAIKRDIYLNKLINKKHNGLIKVVTGIRRCGKSDLGLRNARLNFRQLEETHTLNKTNEKGHGIRKQLEIDFVCNKGSKRYYIQSAYAIPDQEKMKQEQRSLMLTGDFFKKIIITKDAPAPYYNDDGVLVMSVYDFLLNEGSLDH